MAKKLLSTTVDETIIDCIKQYQQDNNLRTFAEATESLLKIGLTRTAKPPVLRNIQLIQLALNDLSKHIKEGRVKIIDLVQPVENKGE